MINKEEFEIHKEIVDWMREAGVPFLQAMAVVSYCNHTDRSIPEGYFALEFPKKDQEEK